MKNTCSKVMLLVLLLNPLIILNPTHFVFAQHIKATVGLDSDGDGISDLMEEYHQRNVSVTTTTSKIIVNSNWTRPSENDYNFKRYYISIFPGKSGNAVQTVISTDQGLSIEYTLSEIFIWENLTVFSNRLQMTVNIPSFVEYRDVNKNNYYDPKDEIISHFKVNNTGFNFNTSTEIIDNEDVVIVKASSNDINSTLQLEMLFSDRFYQLPDTVITASPINDYAYLIVDFPFTVNDSNIC